MRRVAVALLVLPVLLLVGLVAVPGLVGGKLLEPRLAAAVRAATGRELRIEGGLQVSLVPDIGFTAEGLRVANAPGGSAPDLLTLASLAGKIRLLPLLGGRVVVEELVLREPALHLEVSADGRANWERSPPVSEETAPPGTGGEAGSGLPVKDVTLADVRLENGAVTFRDAVTGQALDARQIELALAVPGLSRPLSLTGGLNLNGKAVTLGLSADTPSALLAGDRAGLRAEVASAPARLRYDGALQQRPLTGLDGRLDVEVPSVGQLLAWLGLPLAADRPDPGPLRLEAVLTAAGARLGLERAVVEGDALKLRATGSLDGSGPVPRVALALDGDVLDLDAYLPSSAPEPSPPASGRAAAPADSLAALPDEAIDLAFLRRADADVRVAANGVRAMGYELGRLALSAGLRDGVLQARLGELRLYGGNVTGELRLDGGDGLGVEASLAVDAVDVGALGRAAAGGAAPTVAGSASGTLRASGRGRSPRDLAASLRGDAALDLGGLAAGGVPAGTVSDLRLALDLPGPEGRPRLEASGVYNREPVTADVTLDPLGRALTGDELAVEAEATSAPVRLRYAGTVRPRPVAGLRGDLSVEVPSVGRLLAWLGRPLGAGQPDPGPLTLGAELTAAAAELGLRRATLEGKAAKLRATGAADASQEIVRFEGDVDLEAVDLDAYLPAREAAPRPAEGGGQGAAVGWSEEPFELGALGRAAGRARVRIGEVRYRGLPLREGVATLALAGGVLTAGVDGLRAAGGTIAATATVDASRPATALAYRATISGVQARPVLQALAGTDRLSGTAAFEARGEARGRSQKELVGTLGGDGRFRFRDGAVHGVNIAAALRRARTLGLAAAAGEAQKTDFAELGGSFVIADGVVETRDLHLQAPLLQLNGIGRAALPPRTLDYQLVAKLVGTLEGQDGREAALVGLPIPIRVTGSFDRPAYGVDWESVFREAAKDPARLLAMPQDLRKFGRSLGVDLPAPGRAAAERVGKALEAAPGIVGGEGVAGAAAGVLNRLAKPGTTSRPAEPEARRPPGEPAASDVVKGLAKGLLGN